MDATDRQETLRKSPAHNSPGSAFDRGSEGIKLPQRLLLLEDNSLDADLIKRKLTAEWRLCEVVRVENEAGFRAALKNGPFDLILSDYVLPGFHGLTALALAKSNCPDVPFLFVSGAIGDDVAVESLRVGATDYVLKDRLVRLVPAIRRALNEAVEGACLKRSVQQYEALVNSVDGIVWQAELPSLRFTFVSRQAERLLGYPVRLWLEEPDFWQRHIHPEDRQRAVSVCTRLTAKEKYQNFEYRMLAADGRIVWLRDIVSVQEEKGELVRIQGIMVNITARKQAEAARHESETKLEQTNKDLVRKNQEIQNFYHTLSHELKTPLTSAREFISIVMDGLAGDLNPKQSEYLGIARDSCNQLRLCINDLLDATRLETGKMALELKPASVPALLHRIVTTMGRLAAAKNILLGLEVRGDLPTVPLDEHRITQVVTNLLNNAIKYTPARGKISVKAGEAPGNPGLLEVSVTDSGCGIPREEQQRIFDRLYQIKSGDAATEQGVGLGLYLCRELVHLHGGDIRVESEPGKGSTFSFVLPKGWELMQSNLLVIDDDPDLLDMLRLLLAAERYNVRTARDGQEGLSEMRRQTPDIIMLDLAMPRLSGADVLKEIRKDWGGIPVIVYTAFTDGDLLKQALAFSPFTLLAKPCSTAQLLEAVRKVQRSADTALWKKNYHGQQKAALQ